MYATLPLTAVTLPARPEPEQSTRRRGTSGRSYCSLITLEATVQDVEGGGGGQRRGGEGDGRGQHVCLGVQRSAGLTDLAILVPLNLAVQRR